MRTIINADATSCLSMYEHGDGTGMIVQSTDISGALRRNEKLRQAGATKTRDGDHFAASIPLALLNEWAMKRGTTWEVVAREDKLLDQFLAENTKCRIYEGRI